MSYFNEYGTDFSVFKSGHGVLRRTVIDSKTGFEKPAVASCLLPCRCSGRGGGPLTEGSLVKEDYQKLFDVIANLLSIKFTVFVKRQTYHLN